MKKINFLGVAIAIIIMASCSTAGDKSTGTYNGNYNIMGNNYPGKIVVTKVSSDKANLVLTCYSPAIVDNADGVTLTADGDAVTFSYSNSTTTMYDMVSINGTLNGNTVVLDGVLSLGGGTGFGVFTGTK